MKKLIILFVSCFVLQAAAQSTLTSSQWQDDLKFLQETIHKDYPFLFKKTTAKIFDKQVEELYKNIPNLEEHEIIVGLAKIIALFEYGHTDISFRQKPFVFHHLPFNLYQYNDGVYLQGVHKDYKDALGARVIAINDVPIEEALRIIAPVVNSENSQYFKAFGINYLRIIEVLHAQGITKKLENSIELSLEKDGNTFKQVFKSLESDNRVPTTYSHVLNDENWLDARDQTITPLYLKNLDKVYFFEYLPEEKTVYVRQSKVRDDPSEDIPTFYTRVFDFIENNDVEKLVLDVRLNGGGNNYKNKAVITRIIESKKINKIGSLFVIIGRRTFSACQNLVNELDNYTNVIFIGEPTAENVNFYGDTRQVTLPNSKIPTFLSFAWWQDKPQWENANWLVPHIPVDMSFEEYVTNQDPVLQMALSFNGNDFIPDPMKHITDLFVAGNMEQLGKDVSNMIHDERYKFFDFESELNDAGYNILAAEQYESAIAVFSFIAQMFPDSANAWDSLAEGNLKAGNKDKAIELYKKALAMDPNGATGENAKAMLIKISEMKD